MKIFPYNIIRNKSFVIKLVTKGKGHSMSGFQLYTIEETTQILKVTQRTIYNFISSGQLKAVKIGKYWRIKHADLQDFIENGGSNRNMELTNK